VGEKGGFHPQIFKPLTNLGRIIEIFGEAILKFALLKPLQTGIFTVP
jgi:hypothetical protein